MSEILNLVLEVNFNVSKEDMYHCRSFLYVKMFLGEKLTHENIKSIRPGHGLHPKYYYQILGKTIKKDVKKGTPLTWDIILNV